MPALAALVDLWFNQIDYAKKTKWRQFGKTAHEVWGYLGKSYQELYIDGGIDAERFPHAKHPQHRVRIAKTREFVSVMLPYIHNRVPVRTTSPRRRQLPPGLQAILPRAAQQQAMLQQRDSCLAWMMEWLGNYLPSEYNLYRQGRLAVQEALTKGRGVLWHELFDSPNGPLPGSFYESINGLLIDPDAQQWRDAGYIVRRRLRSAWRLATEHEISPETLRGQHTSHLQSAIGKTAHSIGLEQDEDFQSGRPQDEQGDLCEEYQVWSRLGMGHHLRDIGDEARALSEGLDEIGPFVHFTMVPGVPYPLELAPERIANLDKAIIASELKQRLAWPIPFHDDSSNPWPCSCLDFLPSPENCWATSPLEACLPLQRFLDNAYSFLMDRVTSSCRTLGVISKELNDQLATELVEGLDMQLAVMDGPAAEEIKRHFAFIEFPTVNKDVWTIISAIERAFERLSGMDPLLYGGGGMNRQMRSAREADVREGHATSRPDDMADCVENWMSEISAKEAIAARLKVVPRTIATMVGEAQPEDDGGPWGDLTNLWIELAQTDDPALAAAELEYRVEAGTGRRKNYAKQVADATLLTQTVLPISERGWQQTGDPTSLNNMILRIGRMIDEDLSDLMFPPLQPAPPPMPGEQGPGEQEPPNAQV